MPLGIAFCVTRWEIEYENKSISANFFVCLRECILCRHLDKSLCCGFLPWSVLFDGGIC